MGMRPPADDDDEEPAVVAFGIAAVDDRLDGYDVSYPATADEMRETVGHVEVPFDTRGHTVRLEEVLADCEQSRFEDEQDLLNALHPAFERRRQQGASVLDRVRRVLPF
ncbi:hypothetical protein G9C85_04645 [Halorubellus sp. JP-L1]|uniref:DUF5789 family protein n=1 Tax=Halorubellus sp. JP-L1 TaxID=2715753 RepID=UPI00140D5C36|nr:hypothetical protein [Halorubellus sp. JP-L1]NHN40924.1 hypothetical protein [Halorubellus sp. JP-L1]